MRNQIGWVGHREKRDRAQDATAITASAFFTGAMPGRRH